MAIIGALVFAVILGVICGVVSAIIEHNQDPNDPFNPYAYEDEY